MPFSRRVESSRPLRSRGVERALLHRVGRCALNGRYGPRGRSVPPAIHRRSNIQRIDFDRPADHAARVTAFDLTQPWLPSAQCGLERGT